MTPLELMILLHYACCSDDYRGGDFSAPAVREAIDRFRNEEWLLQLATTAHASATYEITERGRVYVQALQRMPLPVQVWVMPGEAA